VSRGAAGSRRSLIRGTGCYLPAERIPSADLESRLGLEPGFCLRRIGVAERRRAAPGEASHQLGARAAAAALRDAGQSIDDVDLLLFHTSCPESVYPTPGTLIGKELGASRPVPVLEVKAACASFVANLHVADGLLRGGSASRVLVVSGERLQAAHEGYERSAGVFGDGGAALLLEAVAEDRAPRAGILRSAVRSDPRGAALCAARPAPGAGLEVFWDGEDVFRSAVLCMGGLSRELLDAEGLRPDEVDHYLFHQANAKILASVARQYELPRDRVYSHIERYGNTSSASVGILLAEERATGRIRPGQTVLMAGFGAGYTWACALYRVPELAP
jgi:3-oxoacyl-[acyl-carrier-protein] synthase-3